MLPPIPPEIFDLIVDHLHGKTITLKACCLISRSWVPRARRHLFAHVEFSSRRFPIRLWMNAFPDPSTSPGHHTRSLWLSDLDAIIAAGTSAQTWVHHFRLIEELEVANVRLDDSIPVSFIQLHRLSPTLKSLRLFRVSASLSEVLNLICSFPLLENLSFHRVTTWGNADGWGFPSTSPRLTGSLKLADPIHSVTRGLLDLPNGLHFSKVTASCSGDDAKLVVNLVSRCSHALESLNLAYDSPSVFRSPLLLWLDDALPLLTAPSPLILSKATKLKELKFDCTGLSVEWITTTLQTIKSKKLRKITITFSSGGALISQVGEATRREWRDLDYLLVELWTSRSTLPTITYKESRRWNGLGKLVLSLLPKLAGKGAVNGVGGYCQRSEW